MINRRSLYWVNFSLAVFIGFMFLIMGVVIVLYWSILETERATLSEFHQLIWFTVYLAAVTLSFGFTALALRQLSTHFMSQQFIAIALLVAGGFWVGTLT